VGVGHTEYKTLPSYNKLLSPHEKVHGNAAKIRQFSSFESNVGDIVYLLNEVNESSKSVNRLLDALVKEKDAELDAAEHEKEAEA
jgi:hypothetical protein